MDMNRKPLHTSTRSHTPPALMRRSICLAGLLLMALATPGHAQQIDELASSLISPLIRPYTVAVDANRNVYVDGYISHNVFKVTPGGVVTELMNMTGDGAGPQRPHRGPTD